MYILAIDQGTTGTTTVLYNKEGEIGDKAYVIMAGEIDIL